MTIPEDFELVHSWIFDRQDLGQEEGLNALGRIRTEFDSMRTELALGNESKPPAYDQGFRDALLTVKALVTALRTG
ncbi:MAG TPA: hypothetical protein VK571_02395, partial [Gemmatimonadaceae bacterium]|nr:hypothetical protein [Gemmatimonadaceae bacterium]